MNPCGGCSGTTIALHDEFSKYVPIKHCPWIADWKIENYLLSFFGHYKNGHLEMEIADWPDWITQGVSLLSRLMLIRAEEEAEANKHR